MSQFFVAYAIALFSDPESHGETSANIPAREEADSNVRIVRIENNSAFGHRWVTVIAQAGVYKHPLMRSDEDDLFVLEPTWPFPADRVFPGLHDTSLWPQSVPESPAYLAGSLGQTLTESHAIGWPYLCLIGYADRDPTTKQWTYDHLFVTRKLRSSRDPRAMICVLPRWKGVAANTVVYSLVAASLWVFGPIAKATRGWQRKRQARCPSCGYDRSMTQADAVCPECGLKFA